jgi:hypothetical protein
VAQFFFSGDFKLLGDVVQFVVPLFFEKLLN